MKVLAVTASGRPQGNTNTILREILRGAADQGYETNWLDLNQIQMKGCLGCLQCKNGKDRCVIQDDLTKYFEELQDTDVLVLGTPNYIHSISGQMKTFIDRHYSMKDQDYQPRIRPGKRVIYVFSQGEEDVNRYDEEYRKYISYMESHGLETLRYWIYVDDIPAKELDSVKLEAYTLGYNL